MFGTTFSRLTPFERLLGLFTSVRPGEGRIIFLLLAQVYLLLLSYYVIRPVRETLILVEGSPEIAAYSAGVTAVVLIFLIPLYKLVFDNVDGNGSKSAMLRWIALFFIVNMLIFAFLIWLGIPVAVPFYIWVGVFSVMVVAQFWAFAADLLNIKTGQRLFAVIMVGVALGALTGAQVAGRLYTVLGPSNLMLLSALLLLAVVGTSMLAERSVPEGSRSTSPERVPSAAPRAVRDILGGFYVVARSRYLLLIAFFILTLNCVRPLGGFILRTFLDSHATETVAASAGAIEAGMVISRFWGDYYSWVTGIQALIQLFLVSRVFRWFGIRGAILVLPLMMVGVYSLIALVPVFALVRVLRIAEESTTHSLQGTVNHSLYLPVTREEKYVGKTTVDTFFYRTGTLTHSLIIFVAVGMVGLGVEWIIGLNIVLATLLFALGTAIGKHHHGEIRHNLTNLPPKVTAPLPDVYAPAGQKLMFSIPDQAFMDPDPGDTLSYSARLADGLPLPRWVRFDRHNQTFTVYPPAGRAGKIRIELVATDFEGLSVQAQFDLEYGGDPVPRFSAGDEAAWPGQATRSPAGGSGNTPLQ